MPRRLICTTALLASLGLLGALARGPEPAPAPAAPPPAQATPPAPAAPQEGTLRFGVKEPSPAPPGTLRIMDWNVENLFDDQDDPALVGDIDDKNMTKPAEQRAALARAIARVNPDIIALQEVESEQALRWFRDTHLKGLGYDYLVSIDSGDARGIECALLSKFPLSDPQVWPLLPLGGTHPEKWGGGANPEAGKPIVFRRSPLRATVTIPGAVVESRAAAAGVNFIRTPDPLPVTIFVAHQKSGGPGGYWRERESAKTAELYSEFAGAHPGALVFIAADMNTTPGSAPIENFLRAGLVDVFADRVPGDDATTTHASGRVIDYLFASPAAAARLVKETRFILAMPVRAAGADYRSTPPPPGYATDHMPVVVDMKLVP